MGSAVAALFGLMFGLMLHGPWQKHPGGPQIWFSSAAAEALADPDRLPAASEPQPVQLAEFDYGPVYQEPLPVTRLDPDRFDPRPALAEDVERVPLDEAAADAEPAPAVREVDQALPVSP